MGMATKASRRRGLPEYRFKRSSRVNARWRCFGYLLHFFSRRKQAAHDMAAAALVLKGAREAQRDPKDTLAFPSGVTAATLALLWGARMLQFNALVAPYRAATMVEAPRPQTAPMRASAPRSMRTAQESAAAMAQPGVMAPTPAPKVSQSGGDGEGRYGDIWRMIRASAQRNDDDVRRAQAEIEGRPKSEHTNRKEARKLNQLGLDAYRAKQIDEAVARFSEAHRADPRDQEICGNLGLALLDAGKLAEAEVALLEALLSRGRPKSAPRSPVPAARGRGRTQCRSAAVRGWLPYRL